MASLPALILQRSLSIPMGSILAPREFLHLGSRAAVDQAFCRLAKDGHLQRVARGLYIAASSAASFGEMTVEAVVQSVAAVGGASVAICGEEAARSLGLTSKVSDKRIFFTSGRNKQLRVGKSLVSLLHAPHWMLALGSAPAGDAIRVLAWAGPNQAQCTAMELYGRLSATQWDSLCSVRASLPSWMAIAVSNVSTAHVSQGRQRV